MQESKDSSRSQDVNFSEKCKWKGLEDKFLWGTPHKFVVNVKNVECMQIQSWTLKMWLIEYTSFL